MAQNNPFLDNPFDALVAQTAPVEAPIPKPEAAPAPDADTAIEAPAAPRTARGRGKEGVLPPEQYTPLFVQASQKYNVPVNVVMALANQESDYNPKSIGTPTQWGRAKGMMQYLDSTAEGGRINPFDAGQSIDYAAKQIRERLDKGASMEDAVKEHFAGPDRKLWGAKTQVYGREVMERAGHIGDLFMGGATGTPSASAGAADPVALQSRLDKAEPGRYRVVSQDDASNQFSTATMDRDVYGDTFKAMNPTAPPSMLEGALKQWDTDNQARMTRAGSKAQDGFDLMGSPNARFDMNLNKTLQGPQNGIVPKLAVQTPGAQPVTPPAGPAFDAAAADKQSKLSAIGSQLGQSLKAGGYDLLGAGAKILDEINPWTLSPGDAAVLFKNDPAKLKSFQDQSATMFLSRFAQAMTKNSDEAIAGTSDRAKRDYGSLEYATLDPNKTAFSSPVKVVSDAIRSLPTSAAMAVSVYLTRGAAARAEQTALASGLDAAAAKQVGIAAGAKMMSQAGAASEGTIGYAQQALQSSADVGKVSDADLAKSPKYQQLLREGFTPSTARAKIAADTGEQAGQIAGIVDATVNAVGGEFLGKILTEGGKFIPRVMKGFANEAATEAVQSAGEQVGQNIATRHNVNPSQSLGEGVAEATVQGAAVGGLMGGTMAGAGGAGHHAQEAPQVAPQAPAAPAPAPAPMPTPAQAAGPMSAAVETAAGKSNQVVGDDGKNYQFTIGENGITMAEAPPAGPMTAALDKAVENHVPDAGGEPAGDQPETQAQPQNTPAAAEVSTAVEPKAKKAPAAKPEPLPADVDADGVVKEVKSGSTAPVADLTSMDVPELRDRLKYIVNQAKGSGWDKRLMGERRRVEKEINERAAAPKESADALRPVSEVVAPKPDAGPTVAAQPVANDLGDAAAPAGQAQNTALTTLHKDLAGAKPRYAFGNKQFELTFASDIDRAAYIAAQKTPSKRDADYVGFASKATGMTEQQVRDHGAVVRDAIKAQARDAEPGTLAVPAIYQAKTAEAPAQPNAHAGKWFGSREKADAYVAKKSIGDTHVVEQTGKVRFEIKPIQNTPAEAGQQSNAAEVGNAENPGAGNAETAKAPVSTAAPTTKGAVNEEASTSTNENASKTTGTAEGAQGVLKQEPAASVTGETPAANDGGSTATPPPASKQEQFSKNKVFTQDRVNAARARLKSKLSQLNSGVDPEMMMDGLTLAGAHLESGVRKFADYAKAMTDDFGDAIKPYLLSFYEAARHFPGVETDGMSTPKVAQAQHDAMMVEAAEVAKPAPAADTGSKEIKNDTGPTAKNAEGRPEGEAAGGVRQDANQRDAANVPEQPNLFGDGIDGRGAPAGDQRGNDRGPAGVRGESAVAPADAEQRVQSGRGSGAEPSNRADKQPVSAVGRNYRIAPGELTREGSWAQTADRNLDVVDLIKKLATEKRKPTDAERAQMAKFTGWGASEIANGIFPNQYGNYKSDAWRARGERLKALLTPEEYEAARRTTQYAHYTSEGVIRSIYNGLDRLGFKGGTMVEPGMGTGSFAGLMPNHIAANSHYTGIEYDPITAAIAKALYPQSNITHGDFTKTALPKDFFDAAIGNPPFSGTLVLNDPEYKSRRPMLHDYFFMKTLDRVKPGGLLVFVTSKGTMDKTSDKSRSYLAERANLLGAIRLPQTAFQANAGTEVVTDVIFLQKRGEGIPDNGVQWMNVAPVQAGAETANVNEYFAAHPEMVLGDHATTGSMYRANEYTVTPHVGADIETEFAKAIENLPENVSRPPRGSLAERALVQDRDFNPKHKKEGGLYVSGDGNLMQVEDGSGVQLDHRTGADGKKIAMTPKQKKWLRDYVTVRDALKQAQFDQLNEGPWEASLKTLNDAYEAFTKANGPILDYTTIERTNPDGSTSETKRYKNEPLLRMDAEGALAYALEKVKEDGTIVKGVALSERVLKRPAEPEIKTTNDALFVSLNRTGALDVNDVAALAGTDRETVLRDLGTAVYEAPGGQWQLADEYTSGNVLKKLKEAQAAAKIDKRYARNVDALLAVQPKPLGPTDISVRLGANWVPPSDIQNFAKEVLEQRADVAYSHLTGQWNVTPYGRQINEWNTEKVSAGALLDSILNNRQIKVTWRDNEGKTHTDLEATEKANDVASKMKDAFRSWIWKDTARSGRLVQHYNDNFNNIAPRQFDGSHLTLPGMTARFVPHAHQKRGVWRVIQQGDTYLAHAVGAGKTAEMIMAGMEERRLGLSQKPTYVVPNHMLAQFSREFLELYPAANIMVADENNFHTHNRKRFIAQAALNNPDAIVITHSAFGRVGMSDEFTTKFVKNQIAEWQAALADADSNDRITVKQIEKRIEGLEKKLEGKQGKDKKDQVMTFEELGADRLFVDEFHEFRKLDFPTNQGNIKGIDPNGSQKSLDLFMKVQYLREKKPGRVLVGASGTPVTNTMGELYTAQRFFQPKQLEEDGLTSFDAWASQYGDVATGFEQNAAGGYEMVSRFAKFVNVPELMRRVRSFMDILTGSNLGALVQRPDVETGGRQIIVTPAPVGYKEYQKTLEARIKKIRETKGKPTKGADIILKVIGDGRFSAIDMRFVDPTLPSDPNSKLNQMLDAVISDYHETANYEYHTDNKTDTIKGASHLIFSDIGLGEQSAASRGFDMRAWMEHRFAEAGIPKEHVAFMRDYKQSAKKERLFADMREGKKRILIGGKEMETGTNVQKRLVSEDQLDAPWFPASVEQREGRIIRQGNQNPEVRIRAHATKGSYDSTMWGMNARKARFIEQAMNGDDTVRSLDDVSEASAFEMAAALASGDERFMRLAGLKSEVEKMERLRHAHYDEQSTLKRDQHHATDRIERNEALIEDLNKAIAKRQPVVAGEFSGKVGKDTFDSREEFSMALFDEFKRLGDNHTDAEETLATVGGFPVKFYGVARKGSGFSADLHVDIPGDPHPILAYPIDPGVAINGLATRALNQINGMDRVVAEAQSSISMSKRTLDQVKKRIGAAFPEEQILMEKFSEMESLQAELATESAAEVSPEALAATPKDAIDQAGDPKFSVAPASNDQFAADILAELAVNDEMFQYGKSTSSSLEGVMSDIDPGIKYVGEVTAADERAESGADRKFLLRTPAGHDFYVFEKGKQVWLDVSRLPEGGGGSRIYSAVANYAFNNKLKFVGDPAGLSDVALRRRTENMLSSALKFGTTDHLEPHDRQLSGDEKLGVAPLQWHGKDISGNIQSLINSSLGSLLHHVPELQRARYDFATGTFQTGEGKPLTDGMLRTWHGHPRIRAAGAGSATLKRAIVLNTLVRSESGERPGLLESVLRQSNQHVALDRIFYSVRSDGKPVAEFGPVHDEFENKPAEAITRLLADKTGEAVATITRPDLGEISLVYGTDAYGLKHIAERRGMAVFKRLPDLLRNGALYTKEGQVGRVFIGDNVNEAALRLDWSGEAKTWLVSAYEKHPEQSAPVGIINRGTSGVPKSQRSTVVLQRSEDAGRGTNLAGLDVALRSGALGGPIGKLIDSGRITLYPKAKKLPSALRTASGIQAVTDRNDSIHMVANTLTPERAQAVLLHEMFHGGVKSLIGSTQWSNLQGRLGSLYRQSEQSTGRAREFFDKARQRVADAKKQGGVSVKFEVEEFGAYAIEEYESAPASVRKWVDDLIGAVKAWLVQRFGVQLGQVTPAQLRAFSVAALRPNVEPSTGTDGPRFSVAPAAAATPAEPESLTPPEQGLLRRVQALVQDNMNRVKQVQDRIEKLTGAKDLGYADYYGAETNRPGRVAARLEDMETKLTKPLMADLAKSVFTQDQLSELLHAQHAQERNERIAAINADMPDGGSGMATADANAILAKYAGDAELHKIANQARAITSATLDMKLQYGLITQEDRDALANAYQNYVPLKGDGEFGPKIKRAMGHEGRDEHILENIARDYSQAVVVGEKNLARQSLLSLVLQNADSELWTIGVPPKGRYVAGRVFNIVHNGETVGSYTSRSQVDAFMEAKGVDAVNYEVLDSNGDQVKEFTKRLQNNEVMVYVAGDPVRIQIKDEVLARQLRPLDQGQMNVLLENMRLANRYFSKIYTGYNPAFILRNAARDAMTGTINMIGNEGALTAGKAWLKYPQATAALAHWAATGKTPAGKTGEYLTEYRMNGGKTGASWMSDLEQQGKTLTRLYEDAYGAGGYLKDGKVGRAAKVAGRKVIGSMAHVVEIANTATENGLRLALYMQLREQGAKPGVAAQAAKAVTVDFDRKGTSTGTLGALYLFVNPAIQGTANAAKTLTKGDHKAQAWAALSLLPMLGLFAASSGMDDDKDRWLGRNWDVRTKNFIYHVGTHEIRVPMSQEYAPFYAAGIAIGEALRGESPMRSTARLMSSFLDAYIPLQGMFSADSDNHGADLGLSLVPTVAQPLARSIANRNNQGFQIVPENDFTKDRPDNLKMYRGTKNSAYDSAAQGIAAAGQKLGASAYENDVSKISPETLKMLWATYTGGLGTFLTDSAGLAKMSVTDSGEIESGHVPIVKDFWRPDSVAPIRSRFFDLSKDAKAAAFEFKQAKKAGDDEAMDKILRDPTKAELMSLDKMTKATAKASAKLRDEAVDINADKTLSPVEKRTQLKALDVEEEAVLRDGISAFR